MITISSEGLRHRLPFGVENVTNKTLHRIILTFLKVSSNKGYFEMESLIVMLNIL